MLACVFEFAFAEDTNLPALHANDFVLVQWLQRRLGRAPSWLEVLTLRAGLRERARRAVWWRWWRRLRRPYPPRPQDLVTDFLLSLEGQLLSRLVGSIPALWAQLRMPDPWEGFDGRHPRAIPRSRQEAMRERLALGFAVPAREQVTAVLAYAEWKLSGMPLLNSGHVPEEFEFLAPSHAAAINAMSGAAAEVTCARVRGCRGSEVSRRALLRELSNVGAAAIRLWPGIERHTPGLPLGVWPPPDYGEGAAAHPSPELPLPPNIAP